MGLMSVQAVKAQAKAHGASLTEYLTAVLLLSLMEKQAAEHPNHQKPVALAIPINLPEAGSHRKRCGTLS